ncbi:MAG TPA: helical backbone metal receptor, partial [Candidatus Dormibacteraeota bacterium]|nr:helical backbone metal receptor [Candidatus Dormibacteraeota bacterium]
VLAIVRSALLVASIVAPHRIVSLLPSLTEDLCALGLQARLIAVSSYSSDIPCAKGKPRVGDYESVDAEKIVAMHADLVLGLPSQMQVVAPLRAAGIRVLLLPDESYDDIFTSIARIGDATGEVQTARALIARLKSQVASLHARTRSFRWHPRVFVALSVAPIWTVGPQSYLARIVELAGGRLAVTQLAQPYATYSAEALLASQPDVILATRDSGLQSTLKTMPWRDLRAVRDGRLLLPPNDDMFVHPSPRFIEGLRWLVQQLQRIAGSSARS